MLCGSIYHWNLRPVHRHRRVITTLSLSRRHTPLRITQRAALSDERIRRGGLGTEAVAESASSFDVGSSPIDEIVKYFTTLGWEKAWIDGVTERIAKKQLITTADKVKASCEYLLGLGLQQGQLCNMASLCYPILGYDVDNHLKPVVDYLTSKGVNNLPKLLSMQPKLLDYTVAEDGSCLMKGKVRVIVKVEKKKQEQEVLVVSSDRDMNPELRAQVEKLDVWRMTLVARQQRGANAQTEEEKRLAWQAYYECELSKSRTVKGDETEQKGIYVPQCFKEIAAENGIQTDAPPLPSKLVSKKEALEHFDSMMQSAANKESELNERISRLEAELVEIRNDCSSLLTERETLVAQLKGGQGAMADLEQTNASLIEQRTTLESEIEKLKKCVQQGMPAPLTESNLSIENQEEIEQLRMTIEHVTEESEKSKKAFEEERTEKEAVVTKMKHAKQQFDKLRKQSHDRNAENEELKAEIERMRMAPMHSETSTSITPDDVLQLQSTLQHLQQEKADLEKRCTDAEEGAIGLNVDLVKKDESISKLTSQVEATDASLQETKLDLERMETEKQSMARLLEQCQHELESKTNELDAAKIVEAEVEERLKTMTIEIEDLSEILDQREQEMEALLSVQEEISVLRNETVDKDTRLEESTRVMTELQETVSTLMTEKEKAEQERDIQVEALEGKEAEILKLKEQNEELKEEISDQFAVVGNKDFEIVEMRQETEKMQKTSMEQAEALSKRESEILKLKQEFHTFMIQTDQLNAEILQKDRILVEKTVQFDQLMAEAEEREIQRQLVIQEKENEIDQLEVKLQASLSFKDELESEMQLCLTQMNDKDAVIANLHQQFEQEMLIKDQQYQEFQKERETLLTKLKTTEDTFTSSESMKQQLMELESLCSEAKANEHTANGKIRELDVALSEALEIAEMADQVSRQAVEQREHLSMDLRLTQEQLSQLREQSRGHEDALVKADTLQMQLSRKDVEVESLKTRYQTSNAQLEDVTSKLATVRHELATTKGQLTEMQHRLSELTVVQEQLLVSEKVKESIQTTLEAEQLELQSARDQTVDVQRQLETVMEQRAAIERRLELSKERQSHLQDRIKELETEVQSAQSVNHHPDVQNQLIAAQTELHQLKEIREKQKEEIEKLRQQTESMPSLQQKIFRLETALAISGQSQQPPPVKDTNQIQTMQQRAARSEAREADLTAEIKSLKLKLEEARKQSLLPSTSEASPLVGGLSNKKDEDRGYDVEAAVLSGGDPSGFQPLSGLLRGIPAMKYLSPCIRSADFVDRGFIFLMRHPALRYVLLMYFAVLHLVVFV